jgi:hypothetical protein
MNVGQEICLHSKWLDLDVRMFQGAGLAENGEKIEE